MASRSVSPESVGRFRVEAILGSGGMGEVYKAMDPTLQRIVAVKTVRPDIRTRTTSIVSCARRRPARASTTPTSSLCTKPARSTAPCTW